MILTLVPRDSTLVPRLHRTVTIMMEKEQTVYKKRDYHLYSIIDDTMLPKPTVTESDRLQIVDWCYELVDRLQYDRENVAMAMELTDRYLSSPSDDACKARHDRYHFQLIAMTALYTVIKTHTQLALGSDFFSAISEYSINQIETTEMSLLRGLSWHLNAPTSLQICHHILSLILPQVKLHQAVEEFVLDEVKYQTEMSVHSYHLCIQRQSTVTMAAIFNTVRQINKKDKQAILRTIRLVTNNYDAFDSMDVIIKCRNKLASCTNENENILGREDVQVQVVEVHPLDESVQRRRYISEWYRSFISGRRSSVFCI